MNIQTLKNINLIKNRYKIYRISYVYKYFFKIKKKVSYKIFQKVDIYTIMINNKFYRF